MHLRQRDIAISALGFALAGLMLYAATVTGDPVPGLFLLAVSTLWLLGRATVPEAGGIAGRFALRSARLGIARVAAMLAVYVGVCVGLVVAVLDDWHERVEGRVATYALAGLAFLLIREIERASEQARRFWRGGRTEIAVGRELEPLRRAGWMVLDDLPKDRGGNVDHVVTGPAGAFAIETKSGDAVRRDELRQARGNAAWLRDRLGVRWVTPVLCLNVPDATPTEREGVWIVAAGRLRSWFESGEAADAAKPRPPHGPRR